MPERTRGQTEWFRHSRRGLERLQEEAQNLLGELGVRGFRARPFPPMNVWIGDEAVIVTAEVPGVEPASLDVSVTESTLTLRGERPAPQTGPGDVCTQRERDTGPFERSIDLPCPVEVAKVEARCVNGVLTLALPRAESDRPHRIQVRRAGGPQET